MKVVVLSRRPNAFARARRALRSIDFDAGCLGEAEVPGALGTVEVTYLEIER